MAGPAQPSPTIRQCLNGGLGWLQVKCHRCKTEASIPLDCVRRPKGTPIWKLEAEMPIMPNATIFAAGAHDQADGAAAARALRLVHPDEER
jgi:hypothetical protein